MSLSCDSLDELADEPRAVRVGDPGTHFLFREIGRQLRSLGPKLAARTRKVVLGLPLGFGAKPCSGFLRLAKRLLAIGSGRIADLVDHAAARLLERGHLMMDGERHTCTWKGAPVVLTVTEFLILQALAQRPGVVKSRNALMDAAYDDHVYVDDRTIDSHIKRLRKKFKQVDDDFDMIETLYGVGYRFKDE